MRWRPGRFHVQVAAGTKPAVALEKARRPVVQTHQHVAVVTLRLARLEKDHVADRRRDRHRGRDGAFHYTHAFVETEAERDHARREPAHEDIDVRTLEDPDHRFGVSRVVVRMGGQGHFAKRVCILRSG